MTTGGPIGAVGARLDFPAVIAVIRQNRMTCRLSPGAMFVDQEPVRPSIGQGRGHMSWRMSLTVLPSTALPKWAMIGFIACILLAKAEKSILALIQATISSLPAWGADSLP